jgi:EAL domain-containing protein (putative c-di-GMP-specific phosphodiesterase class I)
MPEMRRDRKGYQRNWPASGRINARSSLGCQCLGKRIAIVLAEDDVSRSVGLAHILRQDDGTAKGIWGVFELRTAFQPIFAFDGGKLRVAAFEGLIRPFRDGEPLSPGAFFGVMPAADRFHVETLMRTLHLLNAGACLDPSASIFVNFDPSLFSDRGLAETVLRDMRLVLHEANIHPGRVVCEVTEQKSHSNRLLGGFVEALRAHGLRIAVDDYGAEDSDIGRIEALRPDIVKFDARWMNRLMATRPGFALLRTMVRQFEESGIHTVFEGIEESWQLELAEKSGATMVQGFALARPELAPASFASFNPLPTGEDEPAVHHGLAEPRPAGPRVRQQAFGRRSS